MLEIRIHGRGGQGNVVAAYLLADAAFASGFECQAFPSFGAERRGAPVASFVRVSRDPIRLRCQVASPHFVIVQDARLARAVDVTKGLVAGGGVLLDGSALPAAAELPGECDALAVPATDLALEELGRPLPNVPLLAAFLRLTGMIPVEVLEGVLGQRFQGETLEKNRKLVAQAAERVPEGRWSEVAHAHL